MKRISQIVFLTVLLCVLLAFGGIAAQDSARVQAKSVSPQSGSSRGGTLVTIVGAGFAPGTTVSFGYVPATVGYTRAAQVTIQSPTLIRALTPPHASGTVDLVVSNPDGSTSTLTNAFTYTDR